MLHNEFFVTFSKELLACGINFEILLTQLSFPGCSFGLELIRSPVEPNQKSFK